MTQKSSNEKPSPSLPSMAELQDAFDAGLKEKPATRHRVVSEPKAESLDRILDLDGIRAEKAHRNLHDFIGQAWHIIEPKNPFVSGWHTEAICEALEAVAIGQIKDLLIMVPPRTSKSSLSTIMFQPWCWTKWPHLRWIFASYSAELSMKHSGFAKKVMQSRWYKRNFGDKFILTNDAIKEIENDKSGYRLTTSISGMATGRGGDIIVVDDAHNVKEAHSKIKRESVISWYDGTMSSRAEGDVRKLRRIVIMQRIHDKDLAGHLIDKGGYVEICLPMEFVPKSRCIVPEIDFKDPRTVDGELIDKDRFDVHWIDKRKGENKGGRNSKLVRELDSWSYAGQYQQDPVPLEGGMAKRKWFEDSFYHDDPMEIYAKASKVFTSWDMSFKDEVEAKGTTSYVVGTVWGRIRADLYLIHMFRAKIGFNDTLKAFVKVHADFPKAQEKLVEDKANGTAIMNTLRRKINGIIAAETNNDPKEVRYGSVLWLIEAGNVRLPDPDKYPWVDIVLDEACRFPKASMDDIVDSMTHALIRHQRFSIDPNMFPVGVGNSSRFDHEWSPDEVQATSDRGILGNWGMGKR